MNFPKVTQHVNGRHRIKTQVPWPLPSLYLPPCCYTENVPGGRGVKGGVGQDSHKDPK